MLGDLFASFSVLNALALIWVLPWTGYALWKSARRRHSVWFVVIFLINTFTLAILSIFYIFVFSEMKFKKKKKNVRARRRKK